MNYTQHYELLIARAKGRKITGYIERHHIVPRCLGGTDLPENLVNLTAEEHYVAHQLLMKMYPKHNGLVWAAIQMIGLHNGQRSNNKIYGWIRKKHQLVAKQRVGDKNGSFGKPWYYDPVSSKAGKFKCGEQPQGWLVGRCARRIRPKRDKRQKQKEITEQRYYDALLQATSISGALRLLKLQTRGAGYSRLKAVVEKYNLQDKFNSDKINWVRNSEAE